MIIMNVCMYTYYGFIQRHSSPSPNSPSTKCICFASFTNNFTLEHSRPFILPHEFIQSFEVPFLGNCLTLNHKLFNLILNTNHDFPPTLKKLISSAQQTSCGLFYPLKHIIEILAELLMHSSTIKTQYSNVFIWKSTLSKYKFIFLCNSFYRLLLDFISNFSENNIKSKLK